MSVRQIPFLDLHLADEAGEILAALTRVVESGWFVLGPEVDAFETEFADLSGIAHAIGTGNGTDAIAIALRALDIGPGDEVITAAMSATYTALAIAMVGARPVFADIDSERLTLSPAAAEAAITSRTRAILPVHLYGQPADMPAFAALASKRHLALVEDCCQAHLATCAGRPVGAFSSAAAFSFYPTKNLGALGDGGAIVTDDPSLAARMKRIRNGGQTDRYRHQEIGVNSRLDELQAAVLRVRLPRLRARTEQRRLLAAAYRQRLAGSPIVVPIEKDPGHVYHLFPVTTTRRSALQAHLRSAGIETLVHYPIAISRQPAFAAIHPADCPNAERVADEVLSLPLHPGLPLSDVDAVAEAVQSFAPHSGKEQVS
jgi:dTDP-4-amino-4,6-dideoxygalactose transaminase